MKSIRECTFNAYLDLPTLLWTRGRDFPLAVLGNRLKCPASGSREMSVMFVPCKRRAAAGELTELRRRATS